MAFSEIPDWGNLSADLQTQLAAAHLEYGGRSSGQELWELGPNGLIRYFFS